nr:unnamed protein product [Spirometra erinaceieuropaei]
MSSALRPWLEDVQLTIETNKQPMPPSPSPTDAGHTPTARDVRSLLDNLRSDRPGSRTVIVAQELARYKVDVVGLSETRRSFEQGPLEVTTGHPKIGQRDVGVVVVMQNDVVGRLPCPPQVFNGPLVGQRLPLRGAKFVSVVSAKLSQ